MFWALVLLQALPDSAARAQMYARLQSVASTVGAVRGAAAHFRQDLARASDALVVARARRVRSSCGSALAAADSLAALLNERRYTPSRGDADQRALADELGALRGALSQCQNEWGAGGAHGQPDSVRAWGPFRLSGLERFLRRYEQRAARFRDYVTPPDTTKPR